MLCTRIPSPDDPKGFSQCLLPGSIKKKITSTPGYPCVPPTPITNAYRVDSAGSKGLGMFATQDIEVGDLIVAERPILVIAGLPTFRFWELTVPRKDRSDRAADFALTGAVVEFIVRLLDAESQKAFCELQCSVRGDANLACGILRSNLQLADLGDEGYAQRYISIMKNISRVNHSCAPNTVSKFDMASFSFQLRAARPIPKGVEITTSYSGFHHSHEFRERFLKSYGIDSCLCTECTRNPALRNASDTIRDTMVERAGTLYEEVLKIRSKIREIIQPLMQPTVLDGPGMLSINTTEDAQSVRGIYDRAKELMGELEKYGLEVCVWYKLAAKTLGWSTAALMFHSAREMDVDDVILLRKRVERILKAHEGEDGEEYIGFVRENRLMEIEGARG